MEKYSEKRLDDAFRHWSGQLEIINSFKLTKEKAKYYAWIDVLSNSDVKLFEKRRHTVYKKCKKYCEMMLERIENIKKGRN